MTRYVRTPFQFDKPAFVKTPFRARGRLWEAGSPFKWKEMRLDPKKVMILYNQGFLYHSDELEEKTKPVIGDGLDELNLESLHAVVDSINEKVAALGDSKVARCKKSNLKDKQVGLIRNWRIAHGEHE